MWHIDPWPDPAKIVDPVTRDSWPLRFQVWFHILTCIAFHGRQRIRQPGVWCVQDHGCIRILIALRGRIVNLPVKVAVVEHNVTSIRAIVTYYDQLETRFLFETQTSVSQESLLIKTALNTAADNNQGLLMIQNHHRDIGASSRRRKKGEKEGFWETAYVGAFDLEKYRVGIAFRRPHISVNTRCIFWGIWNKFMEMFKDSTSPLPGRFMGPKVLNVSQRCQKKTEPRRQVAHIKITYKSLHTWFLKHAGLFHNNSLSYRGRSNSSG